MDINELKKQLIPYWHDIYNLQYGNILKQLFVRIKYRILGNRFGTSEIPDNILETIARTMLPDIRKFFLSKEGQEEFAAWKAEYEKNKKKEHKVKGEGESLAFSSLLIDKFIQDKFPYSALNDMRPSDLFNLIV